MPATHRTFHLFGSLPAELRWSIWLYCLPHRTLEIEYSGNDLGPTCDQSCMDFSKSTEENCQPPLLLGVCRESRHVARQHGREVMFGEWATWMQPRLDQFLLLHTDRTNPFERVGEEFCLPEYPDRRLNSLFGWAKQNGLAPCIFHLFIEPFSYHDYRDNSPWPLSRIHVKEVALITQLAKGLHLPVSVKAVTLHLTREQAAQSGLFGVFAENVIQLVDAYDGPQLYRYYNLWLHQSDDKEEDARGLFSIIIADDLPKKLDQWVDKAVWTMLAALWVKARSEGFPDMCSPQEVWVPRVPTNSVPNHEANCVNDGHPWVEQVRNRLPLLLPKIEFRVCWKGGCLALTGLPSSRPETPDFSTVPVDVPYRPGSYGWSMQEDKKRRLKKRGTLVLEDR